VKFHSPDHTRAYADSQHSTLTRFYSLVHAIQEQRGSTRCLTLQIHPTECKIPAGRVRTTANGELLGIRHNCRPSALSEYAHRQLIWVLHILVKFKLLKKNYSHDLLVLVAPALSKHICSSATHADSRPGELVQPCAPDGWGFSHVHP